MGPCVTLRFLVPRKWRNRVCTRGYKCGILLLIIISLSSHRKKAKAHLSLNSAWAPLVNITVSPLTSPVTFDKLINFPEPCFLHLYNGHKNGTDSSGWFMKIK